MSFQHLSHIHITINMYSRKKRNCDLEKVNYSIYIQRISMKFSRRSVSYPNIISWNFTQYHVRLAIFHENSFWLLCSRTTTCNKLNCCNALLLLAYDPKNTLRLRHTATAWWRPAKLLHTTTRLLSVRFFYTVCNVDMHRTYCHSICIHIHTQNYLSTLNFMLKGDPPSWPCVKCMDKTSVNSAYTQDHRDHN